MSYPVLHQSFRKSTHSSNYISLWNPGDTIHFGQSGIPFTQINDLTNTQHQQIFPFAAYDSTVIKMRLLWPSGIGRNDSGSCTIQVYPSMTIPDLAKKVVKCLEDYYRHPCRGIKSGADAEKIVQRAVLVKLTPGEAYWEPEVKLAEL